MRKASGSGGHMTRLAYILLVACAVAGCASGGGASGIAPVCPEPEIQSPDYIIGAGDTLQIFVWRNPELSSTVPVRPDGKISIPLVEDMPAVGKTPSKLARDLEGQLSEYLRSPEVNIIVANQGSSNQIQIVGMVRQPQSVPYRADIRVLDVMIAVGGLHEYAAGNRSKIVREIRGESTECPIRLDDLYTDGDMSQNIRVYPGDVLVVPEARF